MNLSLETSSRGLSRTDEPWRLKLDAGQANCGPFTDVENLIRPKASARRARPYVVGGESLKKSAVDFGVIKFPHYRSKPVSSDRDRSRSRCTYELGSGRVGRGCADRQADRNTRVYVLDQVCDRRGWE